MIPWQVMVNLMKLAQGYGATITSCIKNKEKVFTVLIQTSENQNCGNQLWHPMMRLKRKYTKDKCGSYMYAGCSKVVITNMTPMKLIYHTKNTALLSFYIQRL